MSTQPPDMPNDEDDPYDRALPERDVDLDELFPGLSDEFTRRGRALGYRLSQFLAAILIGTLVLVFFAAAVAAVGGLGYVIFNSLPAEIEPAADAGWVDLIVTNRFVVWALRVMIFTAAFVLFFLAAYIVMSILRRIANREWLRSGAGLHADVAERVRDEMEDVEPLFGLLAEAERENDNLRETLADLNEYIEHVQEERGALIERVRDLESRPKT